MATDPHPESNVLFVGNNETAANRTFGRLLRTARRRTELSAAEVAERVGVTPAFVRAVERGDQAPSRETALRLVAAVGLVPDAASGPDLTLRDPESGERLLIEFKASRKGDNSRWSLERLAEPDDDFPGGQVGSYLQAVFRSATHIPAGDRPDAGKLHWQGPVMGAGATWSNWLLNTEPRQFAGTRLQPTRRAPGESTAQEEAERQQLLGAVVQKLSTADVKTLLKVADVLTAESHRSTEPERSKGR